MTDVRSSHEAPLPVADRDREPRLTVGIATYNGRHLLEVVLPSLREQTFRDFRVVVVDDASSDNTVAWLASHWPEIEVIAHVRNRGVTATLNSCLGAGRSEFVALLNNDVELHPGCIQELVRALDTHPEAAAAAAKMIDFYDRNVIDGAGDIYRWTGVADRRGQGMPDVGQYDREEAVFGACAGAAVYRRSALEEVGLFDEAFFALQEDVDWSFRAQLRGFSCRYVPTAIAYHMGSATLGRRPSDFTLYHNWRNGIWVVAKNYPRSALRRYGRRFLNSQRGIFAWALHNGHGRVFARVWRDALRGMPAILRKRRHVQRARTIGMRELEELIGSDS